MDFLKDLPNKLDKYRDGYWIWCQMNNRVPNRDDFLGYVSDKQMLEKVRSNK